MSVNRSNSKKLIVGGPLYPPGLFDGEAVTAGATEGALPQRFRNNPSNPFKMRVAFLKSAFQNRPCFVLFQSNPVPVSRSALTSSV